MERTFTHALTIQATGFVCRVGNQSLMTKSAFQIVVQIADVNRSDENVTLETLGRTPMTDTPRREPPRPQLENWRDWTPLRDDRTGAVFSDDGTYRYRLWRTWDAELPAVAFIMLNPSTADESELDPTCRRCKGYAEQWGFGTLIVGNIFALKATDPDELYDHPDPVGPENDDHLMDICEDAELHVAAWGTHGDLHGRGPEVARAIKSSGWDLFALNTTKDGHPNHPLYQRKDAELERYHWDGDT